MKTDEEQIIQSQEELPRGARVISFFLTLLFLLFSLIILIFFSITPKIQALWTLALLAWIGTLAGLQYFLTDKVRSEKEQVAHEIVPHIRQLIKICFILAFLIFLIAGYGDLLWDDISLTQRRIMVMIASGFLGITFLLHYYRLSLIDKALKIKYGPDPEIIKEIDELTRHSNLQNNNH